MKTFLFYDCIIVPIGAYIFMALGSFLHANYITLYIFF